MAGQSQGGDEEITGINVTPLVDIMLVLLIVFMVTANLVNTKAIRVDLPKGASAETQTETASLAFLVDAHSHVFLNGQSIDLADIKTRVTNARASGKDPTALISADKEAPHGAVMAVIDTLRKSGVTDFSIGMDAE